MGRTMTYGLAAAMLGLAYLTTLDPAPSPDAEPVVDCSGMTSGECFLATERQTRINNAMALAVEDGTLDRMHAADRQTEQPVAP